MIADVGALIAFRVGSGPRGWVRLGAVWLVLGALLVGAAVLPVGRATDPAVVETVRLLLPTAFLAFAVTACLAAIGAAGGRELIAREHAVAFPVAPHVDHLGALLLSPLNLAWMLQCLSLVGLTSFSVPAGASVAAALAVTALWVVTATVVSQALSWAAEWVRTLPHGAWLLRGVGALVATAVVLAVSRSSVTALVDASPTRRWGAAAYLGTDGTWLLWAQRLAELLGLLVVAYVAGLGIASALARRARREESRAETRRVARRPAPVTDLAAVLRSDRAGVWRSVPLRRAAAVLAVLPGAVAGVGRIPWETMPVLPGLVGSGAALLFGVNAWCLDGAGAWWRESLPAPPRLLLAARTIVVTETVAGAMAVALLLAVFRARETPSLAQVVAVSCATLVITGQIVVRSLAWSVARPYAADLRGARATPAPPGAMAGYSARLALTTTVTGVAFGICGTAGRTDLALLLTLVLSALVARRARRVVRAWDVPLTRMLVTATVARQA